MSNDPTTTPTGEADMPKTTRGRGARGAGASSYPGMMGDGTEEQNLGQAGDPTARITQDEVQDAFGRSTGEPRSFTAEEGMETVREGAEAVKSRVGAAKAAASEKLSSLSERLDSVKTQVRDQVQQSAGAARDWASRQADAAKQLQNDKPVLVLSVSAGAALAVGLLAGFVIGRATADEY